jgi:uncharacterized protein YdeI (BOF family)
MMKSLFIPMLLLLALSFPALAQNNQGQNNNNQGQNNNDHGVRGAPGPIAGAALTVLLIGGGIYWIVRRKKGQARFP